MGLLDLASRKSRDRGFNYFQENRVLSWEEVGEEIYDGVVQGSGENVYDVHIDLLHPRSSHCSCPFAQERQVICKHMLALLLTAHEGAYEEYVENWQGIDTFKREEEEWRRNRWMEEEEFRMDIETYVLDLSMEELRYELIEALCKLEDYEGGW